MSMNPYNQGTPEYNQKQKIIEVKTQGFTDVQTIQEAKQLIRFAFTRERIPLRYTKMGAFIRVFSA